MNNKLLAVLFLLILAAGVFWWARSCSKPDFAIELEVDKSIADQACGLVKKAHEFAAQNKQKELAAILVKMDKTGWDEFLGNITAMPELKLSQAKVTTPKLSPEFLTVHVGGKDGIRYFFIIKQISGGMYLQSCGKSLR